MSEGRASASVIICTRDRPQDLARLLPTVLALEHPRFEVVVIDQSGTQATEDVVMEAARGAGGPWQVVGVEEAPHRGARTLAYRRMTERVGLSPARNEGIRVSGGALLAFTDDDCTVPPGWLRRAEASLARDPVVGLVFGAVDAAPHDSSKTFLPAFRVPRYRRLQGWSSRRHCHALAGANMVARRAVFDAVGGFDECLGAGCVFRSGEDDDIAYRALKAGFAVALDPDNPIVHWGARDYANGAARKLLRNHLYGNGARLAKWVRLGDPLAALGLLQLSWREMRYLASNVVLNRRASGAGRLAHLLMGAASGLRRPLDRKRGLYVP